MYIYLSLRKRVLALFHNLAADFFSAGVLRAEFPIYSRGKIIIIVMIMFIADRVACSPQIILRLKSRSSASIEIVTS